MRIILSRKGFDSSYGGSPSPILEDGTIVSFPIPGVGNSKEYNIRYMDLKPKGLDLGKMIDDLTVRNVKSNDNKLIKAAKVNSKELAHLDPDLCFSAYKERKEGWRGLFGQCDAAQGHLRNQGVKEGDLFLFYGLYRKVKFINCHYEYDRTSKPIHLIWGWMQIDDVIDISSEQETQLQKYPWAKYHPHLHYSKQPVNNTLYVAKEHLDIDSMDLNSVKGYGVFDKYCITCQLTDPDSDKTSYWRLPGWMYRDDKPCPISYNVTREWHLEHGYTRLKSYARGQEFVFDSKSYPKTGEWLKSIIISGRGK